MREGVIGGIIGLVFGVAAVLGVGAIANDERDACAKLADLAEAVDSPEFVLATDTHLLDDCIGD